MLKSYHLNGEFFLAQAKSRFWRQASLQAGLWLTKNEKKLLYGIGNFSNNTDYTVQYESYYKPTRVVQFAGAQLGANFRFKLFKPIHFITGLYAQGLIPITLYYRQVWDSLSFDRSTSVRTTKITEGEKLEGRKFYQQQFFIPLGFEASLYKQSVFLRADIDFGILTRYRSTGSSRRMECNGLRGTVSYAFTRRKGLH